MIYRTDGKSIKSLSIEDAMGAGWDVATYGQAGDVPPRVYYALVPFVRRAVTLRANAVSGVPITMERGGRDVSERPEFAALMQMLSRVLWRTEVAICLSPFGAYWRRQTNAAGLNPTPEWLLPHAVWPFITADGGLEYFRYVRPFGVPGAGRVEMLKPDEVVYFWVPGMDRIGWPGTPPGVTAMAAAAALHNKDKFIGSYFGRGAIKTVLLQVPPESKPDDRNRLQAWWRSLTNGISNAWKSVVVSTNVNPVVLGDGLKEMGNESLTREYRQEVAAAFDIPETMLMQGAANYATSVNDRISFYEETIFPELSLILDAINEQWLGPAYDARLVAHPERTEARQTAQLQQAEAVTSLVGQPVLTVDEGRAWLGMEPMPRDAEAPEPEEDEAEEEAEEAEAEEAEDAAEDAAEATEEEDDNEGEKRYARDATGKYRMLPGADDRKAERRAVYAAHRETRAQVRARHAAERKAARERHIAERKAATDARTRLLLAQRQRGDLNLLKQRHAAERKVLRSLHQAERGRVIDRHAAARGSEIALLRSLGAIKAAPPTPTPVERSLAAAIQTVLDRYGEQVVTAVLVGAPMPDGTYFDGDAFSNSLRAAILNDLAQAAVASTLAAAADIGMAVDETVVATEAAEWAREYGAELVKGVTETTREAVRVSVAAFLETPGLERDQLEGLLSGAFSPARAQAIATTEVTRAAAQGQAIYQAKLAEAGLAFERVWRATEQDMCPVCKSLSGEPESEWADRFPNGPPAHPNCKCAVTLRMVR